MSGRAVARLMGALTLCKHGVTACVPRIEGNHDGVREGHTGILPDTDVRHLRLVLEVAKLPKSLTRASEEVGAGLVQGEVLREVGLAFINYSMVRFESSIN